MADAPWITIIGLGEDGPDGLQGASRRALGDAEIIMGPARHLELVAGALAGGSGKTIAWPVPFSDGIEILRGFRGRKVAVLASGDPFWFGAGSVIARHFERSEWAALPAPSTFSHVASRMGWALEATVCLGLHAAPLSRMRPSLSENAKLIVLLRDGDAVAEAAAYLTNTGFGASTCTVFEAVAGPSERQTSFAAEAAPDKGFAHPVCLAVDVAGQGPPLPACSGIADSFFDTDGVMTKRAVRAVTLSALAPRAGEMLWDIGGGSGSIAIEWLLAHPACQAITVEPRADRTGLIAANAQQLGADRLRIVTGSAPDALAGLPAPDAVFIGGGLSAEMISALEALLPSGTRVVANGVTLEAEALLAALHAQKGGDLIRLDVAHASALGRKHAWQPAYPVVQWSGAL